MTTSDIKKVHWQFYGEWRDKWYDDELCLRVISKDSNPLAKLYSSFGLNSLIVDNKWFFEKEGLEKEDVKIQDALSRAEGFLSGLIAETRKYIEKSESVIKELESLQDTNSCTFLLVKEGMVVLWCVFLCDLGEDLGKLVDQRLKSKGFTDDQVEEIKGYFFSISDKLDYKKAEENLQKLATSYRQTFGNKKILLDNLPNNFKKQLNSHVQRFGWLTNLDVDSKPTTPESVLEDIQDLTPKHAPVKKQLDPKLKKKLSAKDLKLLKLVGEHIFFDNLAAERYARLDFLSTTLLSQKFQISFQDLAWYSFSDLEALVKSGVKVSAQDLKERKQFRVMAQINGQVSTFYGSKAYEEINALVKGQIEVGRVGKISGLVACRGQVSGPAKIVKGVGDMDKVKEGDILVAGTTRPDLMKAIRRCVAIVTDTGGITSHAAIVSRELGIPCIVGTKIATQILKDGDLVEVNADEGTVKILLRTV